MGRRSDTSGSRWGELTLGFCSAAGATALAAAPLLLRRDFFLNDDFRTYFIPLFGEITRLVQAGHAPFVTDRLWRSGAILAEYQCGVLNPVSFALIQIVGRIEDHGLAAAVYALFHVALLAGGGYALSRALGLRRGYAVLAALAASTSEWIIYFGAADWIPFLVSLAWTAWAWWALLLSARRPAWRAPAAAFVALVLLSGCPFTDLALVLSLAIASAVTIGGERSRLRLLRDPALAAGLGALMAAPGLAPMAPYLALSARQPDVWRWQADLRALIGVSTPFMITDWRVAGPGPSLFFLPMIQASWFVVPSIANAPWRDLRTRTIAGLVIIAAAFGLLSMTPGLWMFRWMFRLLAYYQFAFVLLGALCLQAGAVRSRPWSLPVTIAVVAVPLWAEAWQTPATLALGAAVGTLLLAFVSGAIIVQERWPRLQPGYAVAAHAVLFLIVAALYLQMRRGHPEYARTVTPAEASAPARTRLVVYGMNATDLGSVDWRLYPPGNLSLEASGAAIQGYSPFQIAAYEKVFCQAHFGQTTCPDIAGRLAGQLPGSRLSPLDLARVDEVRIANPRAAREFGLRFPGWTRQSLPDGGSDFRRKAGFAMPAPVASLSKGFSVARLEAGPDRVRLRVTADDGRAGRLILARAWYPGWRAKLDGRALHVHPVDDLAVAVDLPAGASGVLSVTYWPAGLTAGLVAALAAAAGLIALAVFDLRQKRPLRPARPAADR